MKGLTTLIIFQKFIKASIALGILNFSSVLFAGGFYLQELGTPSSIGTALTSIKIFI